MANGVVYIGDQAGIVYAVNDSTGSLKWSVTVGNSIQFSSPSVANGVVYIGAFNNTAGSVDALKATTGTSLWTYSTPDETQSSPAVVNGMVFIDTLGHWVYAFHLPT